MHEESRISRRFLLTLGMLLAFLMLASVVSTSPSMALPASKQLDQCRLDTWSIRDGLPGYDITALAQTPDGYLWVGTTQGLMRFDGTSFTTFNNKNVPGLKNNTIRALSVARDGALLVGTEWSGYGKLVNGVYHRSNLVDDGWNATRYFHEGPDGTLWVGYQGYHFLVRDRGASVDKIDAPGLYMSGAVDLPGGVLAAMLYGGLFTVGPNGPVQPYQTQPAITTVDFSAITRTADGTIWCGTESNGLYRIHGGKSTHYTTANGLCSNTIRCLYVDGADRLWIGTNNGIASFDKRGFHHFGAGDGLAADDVTAITEDREGNLWVATGVYLNRFANTHLTAISIGDRNVQEVGGIMPGPGNNLFYCGRSGLWLVPPDPAGTPKQLANWPVISAIVGPGGDIYAQWHLSPYNQSVVGRLHDGKWSTHDLPFDPLRMLVIQGSVFIVGIHQEIMRWGDAKPLLVYPVSPNNQFYCLKIDRHGTIWIGCNDGLAYFRDGVGGVARCGLPAGAHVLSIDVSDPKYLWLGTDKGIARVSGDIYVKGTGDIDSLRSTTYGVDAGVPSNDCLQILRDRFGTIWVGGYFGIASIDASEFDAYDLHRIASLHTRIYTAADGIHDYPAVMMPARTHDGKLWFTGSRGVTMIDPAHLDRNPLAPPLVIEECTANGHAIVPGKVNRVAPGSGSLSIRYAGLSYVEPEQVKFRYRLEGFDTTWQEAGTRRVATYTNLPPGRYTFHVVACNNDGVWNLTGASITFELLPYFYETVWFKASAAAVFLALVALIVWARTRRIERHSRELEAKVVERTSELVETNKQLTAIQEELRLQNVNLQESQAEAEAQNEELHSMQGELLAQNDELQSVQAELEAQNQELTETQDYLAQANARLEALATTDGLTGLYNHRTFHELLEREWAGAIRYGTPLSIILLDVDRFKQYNDTHGHPAGDDVLRSVARILKSTAREEDLVCRYGGEEFVAIVPGLGPHEAAELAERLRVAIAEAEWPLREVTASFGVAALDASTAATSDLISHADTALYASKNSGRNRVTEFDLEATGIGGPAALEQRAA